MVEFSHTSTQKAYDTRYDYNKMRWWAKRGRHSVDASGEPSMVQRFKDEYRRMTSGRDHDLSHPALTLHLELGALRPSEEENE